MRLPKRAIFLSVIFVLLAVLAFSCAGEKSQSSYDIFDIKKFSLKDGVRLHALHLARAALTGQSAPAETADVQSLYAKDPRGVFVSIARPTKTALTGFAMGDTIAGAINRASVELKRIASGENFDNVRVRVDIVSSSKGNVTQDPNKTWKRLDVSKQGVIFNTNPPLGFLPQELRDRGVLDHKGKFKERNFTKALKIRSIPSALRKQVVNVDSVNYTRIRLISFMEDHEKGLVNLMRMNRATGFEPTEANLYKSISMAGRYLSNAVGADGSYDYHYYPQTDSLSRDYNELRHAGTTFALMQIYEVTGDPKFLEAAKRALGWLDKNTRGPDATDSAIYDWKGLNDARQRYAKLGGSGLSLLAFGWYTLVTGDTQYVPLMQAYARFVDYMVQENGDVKMRYWYAEKDKGRKTKPVLYYPGEAFYGMATLYKIDGNKHWIDVASKGIDYIVDVRDRLKPNMALPHDHWMAYAINHIYMVKPKESHVKHADRLFSAMDAKFMHEHKYPDMVGGYFSKPASVRVGCRLEATTAFYRVAEQKGEQKKMDQYFNVLLKGASFLMRTQYDTYNTMFFVDPSRPQGAMMRSYWEPATQIDYTQHSVSALIETYNILRQRTGKAEMPRTQKVGKPLVN